MPVTYDRAFGGSARHSGKIVVPFANNPNGRGYVLQQGDVAGTSLPNIEEIDQRITSWEQQPLPAGLAPMPRQSPLRGQRGIVADVEARTIKLEPAAFCCAHPRMLLPAYPGGAVLELTNMHRSGPWMFALPEVRLHVQVALGRATYFLALTPDTLCLLPEQDQFFVLARRALIYHFVPERCRSITVGVANDQSLDREVTSIQEIRRMPSPTIPILPDDDGEEPCLPFDMLLEMYPLTEITERLPVCPSG
jgi:hypothetical protein